MEDINKMIADKTWWINRISKMEAMKLIFDFTIVILVDENKRIVWSTPAVNKSLGYLPEELDGKEFSVIVPPETRETYISKLDAFFENPLIPNDEYTEFIMEGLHKDDSRIKFVTFIKVGIVEGKKIGMARLFPVSKIENIRGELTKELTKEEAKPIEVTIVNADPVEVNVQNDKKEGAK